MTKQLTQRRPSRKPVLTPEAIVLLEAAGVAQRALHQATEVRDRTVMAAVEAGCSYRQLGEALGVSGQAAHQLVRGIQRRGGKR
jgi:DNA-binding CsgD family transcriptional regulator